MLAVFGGMARLAQTPPLPESLANLREIVRTREAAIAQRIALENQLATIGVACARKQIMAQIKTATRVAKTLLAEALRAIQADAGFKRRLEILVSLPGIAEVTAANLIANMPELGSLDAKQAGMLAGLAPIACESGQHKGQRRIRGGRKNVRTGIYMAALSAARHNPQLRRFHERLIDASKPKKVAIAAIMRKLLVLANTLIKEDRCWSSQVPIAKPIST